MTDIDQMTGWELRVEIAKAQGWQDMRFWLDGTRSATRPGRDISKLSDIMKDTARDVLPAWTASILEAWALILEMAALETVNVEACNGMWEVSTDDYTRTIYGHAETAPLAICRAWLKWKREAKE